MATILICASASAPGCLGERAPSHIVALASPMTEGTAEKLRVTSGRDAPLSPAGRGRVGEAVRVRGVTRACYDGAPSPQPSPPWGEGAVRGDPGRMLHLSFHDIAEARPGLVAPTEADIAALLAFAAGWDGARPLLVHCEMGVSRSTAAAFALACARRPDRGEGEIAAALRRAVPVATPNPLVVALADALLGREGRMVRAVREIGRGADYRAYDVAELDAG